MVLYVPRRLESPDTHVLQRRKRATALKAPTTKSKSSSHAHFKPAVLSPLITPMIPIYNDFSLLRALDQNCPERHQDQAAPPTAIIGQTCSPDSLDAALQPAKPSPSADSPASPPLSIKYPIPWHITHHTSRGRSPPKPQPSVLPSSTPPDSWKKKREATKGEGRGIVGEKNMKKQKQRYARTFAK